MIQNFKTAAARLGLSYREADGVFDSAHVYGTFEGVSVESHYDRDYIHSSGRVIPEGNFGLSVATAGLLGKLGHLFRSGHGPSGDSIFDKTFTVRVDDPTLLHALIPADLRAALLSVADESFHPSIDDHYVRLHRWPGFPGPISESEEGFERGIREVARLTKLVRAAFQVARSPRS